MNKTGKGISVVWIVIIVGIVSIGISVAGLTIGYKKLKDTGLINLFISGRAKKEAVSSNKGPDIETREMSRIYSINLKRRPVEDGLRGLELLLSYNKPCKLEDIKSFVVEEFDNPKSKKSGPTSQGRREFQQTAENEFYEKSPQGQLLLKYSKMNSFGSLYSGVPLCANYSMLGFSGYGSIINFMEMLPSSLGMDPSSISEQRNASSQAESLVGNIVKNYLFPETVLTMIMKKLNQDKKNEPVEGVTGEEHKSLTGDRNFQLAGDDVRTDGSWIKILPLSAPIDVVPQILVRGQKLDKADIERLVRIQEMMDGKEKVLVMEERSVRRSLDKNDDHDTVYVYESVILEKTYSAKTQTGFSIAVDKNDDEFYNDVYIKPIDELLSWAIKNSRLLEYKGYVFDYQYK